MWTDAQWCVVAVLCAGRCVVGTSRSGIDRIRMHIVHGGISSPLLKPCLATPCLLVRLTKSQVDACLLCAMGYHRLRGPTLGKCTPSG